MKMLLHDEFYVKKGQFLLTLKSGGFLAHVCVILLDTVKEEILRGGDKLSEWLRERNGFPVCNHVSAEIIDQYQLVLQHVQECGLYKVTALNIWSQENIADP